MTPAGHSEIKREVPYGEGFHIDPLLSGPGRPKCYVEVKTLHLTRDDAACFPDAVMFFLVQRCSCSHFAPAGDIDPVYVQGLRKALAAGVEALC